MNCTKSLQQGGFSKDKMAMIYCSIDQVEKVCLGKEKKKRRQHNHGLPLHMQYVKNIHLLNIRLFGIRVNMSFILE